MRNNWRITMKDITELEKDFYTIRAIDKKIKLAIPHHAEIGGLIFTHHFDAWYKNPTFSAGDFKDVHESPRWAKFELVKGVWYLVDQGDYSHRVAEIFNVLIAAFGGERE